MTIKNWLANRKQTVVVEGERSTFVRVESGVPQGSVLGPGLFLYYNNDLPTKLHSIVRLFADDAIAYQVIECPNDSNFLQEDLNTLAKWEQQCRMKFHPSKCTKLTVTTSGGLPTTWSHPSQCVISQVPRHHSHRRLTLGHSHTEHM